MKNILQCIQNVRLEMWKASWLKTKYTVTVIVTVTVMAFFFAGIDHNHFNFDSKPDLTVII